MWLFIIISNNKSNASSNNASSSRSSNTDNDIIYHITCINSSAIDYDTAAAYNLFTYIIAR